jgi:pyruvate/2-oxoglutarate/acetoin dehydrogenase E1 component
MQKNKQTVVNVIRNTLISEMKKNKNIILFGEGIDDAAAMYGTTKGFTKIFGKKRVFEMPLSENCIIATAIGASIMKETVIVNFQRVEFILLALEQIINNAAKLCYLTNGEKKVKIVVRLVVGRGWGQGPTHSQSLESIFCLIPGLKVYMPVFPNETKDLLHEAIHDPNPSIFIENRWCHYNYGKINKKFTKKNTNFIKLNSGKDLTIISTGYASTEVLRLVKFLKKKKINVDFYHLRILKPLDISFILKSIRKNKKIILVDNGYKNFGIMSELIKRIVEKNINFAKAPVVMGIGDVLIPSSKIYLDKTYVNIDKILLEVLKILDIKKRYNELFKEMKTLLEKDNLNDVPNSYFKGPF